MKAVILAGGLGTRLSEETQLRPKPMVEIGDLPILWHIMKIYSAHDVNDFIICCGYKGHIIKEFFANYRIYSGDIEVSVSGNKIKVLTEQPEAWNITLVDTGSETMTGGRLKRVSKYIQRDEVFCFTYGDGLSDINITSEIEFHRKHGMLATIASVPSPGRFGIIRTNGNMVTKFEEKPKIGNDRINGGFFVLSPKVLDYIEGDNTIWEQQPLKTLASSGQLVAFEHDGFWQPMDTLREKHILNQMWKEGSAPWKIW